MNHDKLFRIHVAILTVCYLEAAPAISMHGEKSGKLIIRMFKRTIRTVYNQEASLMPVVCNY